MVWFKPVGFGSVIQKVQFCYTRGILGKMSAEGLKSWTSGQEVVNQKVH